MIRWAGARANGCGYHEGMVTSRLRRRRPPGTTDAEANARRDQLSAVQRLVEQGKLTEAVDLLARINRSAPDPATQIALVDLRARAAADCTAGSGRSPWPPDYADPFPDTVGEIPEIAAVDLTTSVLGGAVAHHGALIVRHILDDRQAARTIAAIDRVQAVRDLVTADRSDQSWYRPFPAPADATKARGMVAQQGGTWLADSPASVAMVLDQLTSAGVVDAIAGHFGERPCISLQKSTLRRSRPINKLTAWHQDGSFLGTKVRTINTWVALSSCGADQPTPGLEVVPKRVESILPTEGGLGPSSISDEVVNEVAADAPVIRPEFGPGDGMVFDERFVHRTYLNGDMTRDRYALECWFFAPSHDPDHYLPLLV
jgi:hypothetical protein